MPVVSRKNPYQLLGLVRRQDIIRAYDLALTRREELQHRVRQMKELQDAEFVDIYLNGIDTVIGKSLQEIAPSLPQDCVLVSVERDGKVIIPHGKTIFQSGDHITAFTRKWDAEALFTRLRKMKLASNLSKSQNVL